MQAANQSIDVNNSVQQAEGEINALKSYVETTTSEKKLRREKKNFFADSVQKTGEQLNKISNEQKRFQRKVPTSMEQLYRLIGLTKGGGGPTAREIRNVLLRAAREAEGEIKTIIQEESLKALGCSQEQKYKGFQGLPTFDIDTIPVQNAIYVPLQSLDLITLANGMLKQNYETPVGKILYESYPPTNQPGVMKGYGGPVPFPFNRQLNDLISSSNSFKQQYNNFYKGKTGQDLMDIKYVTTNEFGVTGNYFKVALIDREGTQLSSSASTNNIGEWLGDYYATIRLFDTSDLTAQILQFISKFISMELPSTSGPIGEQSKFYKILQRILGLCFDQKTEIDVSGNAKVAELDGVDDSFFELTEADLRNLDLDISNVQNGVMEFVDCDNVKVPVDYRNLTSQLINFKETITGQTEEKQFETMEKIINSLSENPNWPIYFPTNFGAAEFIDKNIIENLAIAVASAVLSPKVLLPIFILLKVVETSYALSYNQTITSATTLNQLGIQSSNIITNSTEFLKKFKNFMIQVVSRIGAIFIRKLFEILKKDLLNIINRVLREIIEEKLKSDYRQAKRLIGLAISVNALSAVFDARKCKSLLDEILNILSLLKKIPTKRKKVPLALAVLSDLLPGESPQRAFLNTIKYLQDAGLPTLTLPDGSPNLMLIYNLATHKGRKDEQMDNGVNDTYCVQGFCWSVPR